MDLSICQPLRFAPRYKQVIWGGDRIARYKHLTLPGGNIGESWEVSAVSGFESVVTGDSGLAGMSIPALVERYGDDFLGTDVTGRYGLEFPLLVKIIDARSNLSVQVHPDDDLARRRHNSRGKTEMWYVLDNSAGSRIYCGLNGQLDPVSYTRCVADGTIMDHVSAYSSAPGQFYYVPAGTVHAIGAGNLIAEVQESSDITYRIFDYNRRDADGKPRTLHTAEALEAIDYSRGNAAFPTSCVFDKTRIDAVASEHFHVDYLRLDGDNRAFDTRGRSFAILMVTEGEAVLSHAGGSESCDAGSTVLIPACMGRADISGRCVALLIHCLSD